MSVLLRRLWIQITADRRRFGVFCALVALGFLLWARIIVISNIPKDAVADPIIARNYLALLGAGIGAGFILWIPLVLQRYGRLRPCRPPAG